jgi:leader peptidase (prepilin peptidase)/N-methyltransferase
MSWAVAVAAVAFGAVLGSFATVLIVRIPAGHDFIRGRSACTGCNAEIHWYDNIPVVSWLVLRGKCRQCSARISWMYPAVEVAVASLFLGIYLIYGLSWTAAVLAFIAVVSVALFVIDLKHKRLPHTLVLPSYAIVLALMIVAWLVGERATWWSALVGLCAMGGFYGVLWFIYPRGMGFGDVTTAGLLGMVAGFISLESLAVAAIAGPLVGGLVVAVLLVMRRVAKGTAIPYGPALITGAWLGLLWGEHIAHLYLRALGVA